MDSNIVRLLKDKALKMNPRVCNGFAYTQSNLIINTVNDLFQIISKNFPPYLEYCGITVLWPEQEYQALTQCNRSSKKTVDIAKSDIYMTNVNFKLHGKPLSNPLKLKLPFIREGNIIYVSDSPWVVNAVLCDKIISVGLDDLFVRLSRAKLNFRKYTHLILVNGQSFNTQLVYGNIFNKKKKEQPNTQRAVVKANTTLGHYLMCKYGFRESLLRYCGITDKDIKIVSLDQEVEETEEWVAFESSGIKLKTVFRSDYVKPDIKILLKKEKRSILSESIISGLIYLADHFPHRIKYEYLLGSVEDEKRLWLILLGYININGEDNEGKLYSLMTDHILSLDRYLDKLVMYKLKASNEFPELRRVENFYDLLVFIINNINTILFNSFDKASSIWNKDLEVLYYLLYDLQAAIFKTQFKLQSLVNKKGTIDEMDLKNIFNQAGLKEGLIYRIASGQHREMCSLSVTGDNKAFKLTTAMMPQTDTNSDSGSKGAGLNVQDPAQCLHASVADIGAFLNIPKGGPGGRNRINPYVNLQGNTVVQSPLRKELLTKVQEMIGRK